MSASALRDVFAQRPGALLLVVKKNCRDVNPVQLLPLRADPPQDPLQLILPCCRDKFVGRDEAAIPVRLVALPSRLAALPSRLAAWPVWLAAARAVTALWLGPVRGYLQKPRVPLPTSGPRATDTLSCSEHLNSKKTTYTCNSMKQRHAIRVNSPKNRFEDFHQGRFSHETAWRPPPRMRPVADTARAD